MGGIGESLGTKRLPEMSYGGSKLFPAYLFHGKTFWRFLFLLAILWLVIISISKMYFGKISVKPHKIIMHTALCLTKQ